MAKTYKKMVRPNKPRKKLPREERDAKKHRKLYA